MNTESLLNRYRREGYRVSVKTDKGRYQWHEIIMCLGDRVIVTKSDNLSAALMACARDLASNRGDSISKLTVGYDPW